MRQTRRSYKPTRSAASGLKWPPAQAVGKTGSQKRPRLPMTPDRKPHRAEVALCKRSHAHRTATLSTHIAPASTRMEEHAAGLTLAHRGGGAGGVATLCATTAHCKPSLRIRRQDPSTATAEPAVPPVAPIPLSPAPCPPPISVTLLNPPRPAVRRRMHDNHTHVAIAHIAIAEEGAPYAGQPARWRTRRGGGGGRGATKPRRESACRAPWKRGTSRLAARGLRAGRTRGSQARR